MSAMKLPIIIAIITTIGFLVFAILYNFSGDLGSNRSNQVEKIMEDEKMVNKINAIKVIFQILENPQDYQEMLRLRAEVKDKPDLQSSELFSICGRNLECVQQNLLTMSKSVPRDTIAILSKNVVTAWEDDFFYCHQEAHHLGVFLSNFYNDDLLQVIPYLIDSCDYGFVHGVFETYLPHKVMIEKKKLEEIDFVRVCLELGQLTNLRYGIECSHGMGHGLTQVYDTNVFQAIKKCDEFSTETYQYECQRGVFMENWIEYFKTGKGTFNEFDLLYPCNQVEEKYQKACYSKLGILLLQKRNYSPDLAFQDCEIISNKESTKQCYQDVALYAAIEYFGNIDKTADMCDKANPKFQKNCINGALYAIILFVDYELSDDFCDTLSENFYEFCTINRERMNYK